MKDPHNIKYRAVNLGNKTIADKLLPASGAFEVRAKFNLDLDSLRFVIGFVSYAIRNPLQLLQFATT